jgi:hypothetical protein
MGFSVKKSFGTRLFKIWDSVISVPFFLFLKRQDTRGIGHADGLDWAPNRVGARCLWRHHVH